MSSSASVPPRPLRRSDLPPPTRGPIRRGIYVCTSQTCDAHGVEIRLLEPAELRRYTSCRYVCKRCFAVLFLRRIAELDEPKGPR